MKNRKIDESVRQAFTHAAPDVLDSILTERGIQSSRAPAAPERKPRWGLRLAAMAAVMALILGLGFGVHTYRLEHTVTSRVSLDVNPSIELRVNRQERVLEAVALNEDAKTVLGEMELEGSRLDVAMNAVIGAMLRSGYITDAANSVLISVDSEDEANAKALQEKLTAEVSKLLNTGSFSGAVLSQTVQHGTELEGKAEEFGITLGKAQLIDRITQSSSHTFESLVGLSVHQLTLIMNAQQLNEGMVGIPSEKGYLGRLSAKQAALQHAGLTESQVQMSGIEMDIEDGAMVYEVEFWYDGWDYEYRIHAEDGSVVHWEKEVSDWSGDISDIIPPPDGDIGEELAVETALDHAGVTLEKALNLNCRREADDGVPYYEVTFRFGAWEYEYKIRAYSPVVLEWEKEQVFDIPGLNPTVTRESALATALAHLDVTEEQVAEVQIELEDGVYEIEFRCRGYAYSYEIDARTGRILEFKREKAQ